MKHRALISMLMLENVLRSYRRTCLQQPFTHRSSTVHHDGSRSQASSFSTLKLVLRSSLLIVAHVLHALRVGYAQVCSLARERLAFNAARSILHSLALASSHLLATALCTLIVHSSSLILSTLK